LASLYAAVQQLRSAGAQYCCNLTNHSNALKCLLQIDVISQKVNESMSVINKTSNVSVTIFSLRENKWSN